MISSNEPLVEPEAGRIADQLDDYRRHPLPGIENYLQAGPAQTQWHALNEMQREAARAGFAAWLREPSKAAQSECRYLERGGSFLRLDWVRMGIVDFIIVQNARIDATIVDIRVSVHPAR